MLLNSPFNTIKDHYGRASINFSYFHTPDVDYSACSKGFTLQQPLAFKASE